MGGRGVKNRGDRTMHTEEIVGEVISKEWPKPLVDERTATPQTGVIHWTPYSSGFTLVCWSTVLFQECFLASSVECVKSVIKVGM